MPVTRQQLLELRAIFGARVRASEPWEDSYKKDAATFKRMLDEEQILEQRVAEYFFQLAEQRINNLIRWGEVMPKLAAAIVVNGDDREAQQEETLLVEVILPSYEELMLIGAAAAEAITGVPGDIPSLTPTLLDNARKSTAKLVSGITDTTRATLQKSIQSGIAQGDDLAALTERVKKTINNPVRAEMIAQTETVNAYQSGFYEYAEETGAQMKEWESKLGACKLCAPLNGKKIGIDEMFVLPNGKAVLRPTAHVKCRCGLIYDY